MIETDDGDYAVETLEVGMMVRTADRGYVAIDWIGSRDFGPGQLERMPELRPIRIRAGALGKNIPTTDLLVSPQHRMVLRSRIAQRMFADQEIFVTAKYLVGLPGVSIAHDVERVTYWHIMFRQHEVIFANGAPTESLYLGKEALKTLTGDQLDEIRIILPEIFGPDFEVKSASSPLARYAVSGRLARRFIERTSKASKYAIEPLNKSGRSACAAVI
jgi:hypothetical protein